MSAEPFMTKKSFWNPSGFVNISNTKNIQVNHLTVKDRLAKDRITYSR